MKSVGDGERSLYWKCFRPVECVLGKYGQKSSMGLVPHHTLRVTRRYAQCSTSLLVVDVQSFVSDFHLRHTL